MAGHLSDDDRLTAESLRLCEAFFKIKDRKARLRIIALAESTLALEASRNEACGAPSRGGERQD